MGAAGHAGAGTESELERLRQRVAELECRLRDATEARALEVAELDFGTWELDLGSKAVTASPLACYMLELPAASLTLADWLGAIHPDDRERVSADFGRAASAGARYEAEFRVPCNGGVRWLLAKGSVIRDRVGAPARIRGVLQDVTVRKAGEAELRQNRAELELITDAVPALISYIDRDFRYQFVNRAYESWFERPRERITGCRVPEVLGEEAFARLRPFMEKALAGEPVVYDGLAPYRTRARYIHASYIPDRAPDGEVRGFAVLVEDVTDRKALEKQVLEQQKTESIGLLAGGTAHDFNNLLVGIIGNASLVQEMLPGDDPKQEFLEQIVRAGEIAAHLTKQMLAYSGRGRFVIEPIDVSAVARGMVEMLRASITSKKVAVHLELYSGVPPIEADRGQIEQVFMNLVFNAAEAIGEEVGAIAIRTGVRVVEPGRGSVPEVGTLVPGTYAYLEVRDTGCGMDEATRARIFEPFFTTKFTGRGLGLAAVSGIVRGHRGALEVYTAPGQGSAFVALFPAIDSRP